MMQLSDWLSERHSHRTLDGEDWSVDNQGCRRTASSEGRSHGRIAKHWVMRSRTSATGRTQHPTRLLYSYVTYVHVTCLTTNLSECSLLIKLHGIVLEKKEW